MFLYHQPPRPHKILGLNLDCSHLTTLRIALDFLYKLLLLLFELRPLTIKLSLCLLQRSLMLPQPLSRRHAFAKRPFYDLVVIR